MLRIEMFFRVGRRIVLRALLDPCADQGDLSNLQRRFSLRHGGFAVFGRDHFQHGAFVGMGGIDRRTFVLTTSEKFFEIGHHIAALGFRWLMTALAIGLEDGADLMIITYFGCSARNLGGCVGSAARHRKAKRQREQRRRFSPK